MSAENMGPDTQDVKKVSAEIADKEISFETGRLALQANAAVLARQGDTVVLASAVMGRKRENMDYFPLLVDYEERLYAAGKIKGSRWVKREGRASDEAILTGRVVDRTIRPLFPDGMRNDVQVVVTVLSIDGVNEPDILAVNAASAALTISNIPFEGPVAAVRVGRIDGNYVLNPSREDLAKSDMDLIVSGTAEHIMMVEAGANLVGEDIISGGINFAQKYLGEICAAQMQLQNNAGHEKEAVEIVELNSAIVAKVAELATEEKLEKAIYVPLKEQREKAIKELAEQIKEEVKAALMLKLSGTAQAAAAQSASAAQSAAEQSALPADLNIPLQLEEAQIEKEVSAALDKVMKKFMQKNILEHERRVDGRKLDETRKVTCEVGVLPRTHGSALFTRGETQVLTVVTLGSKGDEQLLDGMEDAEGTVKRYIHHYNMPGYSVGEVAPLRGPGRREIGHGALAERALFPVIPSVEDFPYTMRLVSEAISSNGSTSMASTCGSSLALMDAGVKIREVIGGVAMGLVFDEKTGDYKVLTDIAGIEDFNGHMDFKVTGNENGITALQLDMKLKGLTPKILESALQQAKPGRLHILSIMKQAIASPRAELSQYAPRVVSFRINPEKIREVIGTGGKVINGIIAETGVKIDIEDDGLVMVTSLDPAASEKAVAWIKNIVREIAAGEVFEGKVTRLMNFGAFVELVPGQEGLVHISELANYRVNKVEDVCKVGDSMKVLVKEIDDQGRINLTHKPFAKPAEPGQGSSADYNAGGYNGGSGTSSGHSNGYGRNNRRDERNGNGSRGSSGSRHGFFRR
jgi:polyribonucleotide nucleotidyltransferase